MTPQKTWSKEIQLIVSGSRLGYMSDLEAANAINKAVAEIVIGSDREVVGFTSEGRTAVDMTQSYWNALRAEQRLIIGGGK